MTKIKSFFLVYSSQLGPSYTLRYFEEYFNFPLAYFPSLSKNDFIFFYFSAWFLASLVTLVISSFKSLMVKICSECPYRLIFLYILLLKFILLIATPASWFKLFYCLRSSPLPPLLSELFEPSLWLPSSESRSSF